MSVAGGRGPSGKELRARAAAARTERHSPRDGSGRGSCPAVGPAAGSTRGRRRSRRRSGCCSRRSRRPPTPIRARKLYSFAAACRARELATSDTCQLTQIQNRTAVRLRRTGAGPLRLPLACPRSSAHPAQVRLRTSERAAQTGPGGGGGGGERTPAPRPARTGAAKPMRRAGSAVDSPSAIMISEVMISEIMSGPPVLRVRQGCPNRCRIAPNRSRLAPQSNRKAPSRGSKAPVFSCGAADRLYNDCFLRRPAGGQGRRLRFGPGPASTRRNRTGRAVTIFGDVKYVTRYQVTGGHGRS